jgi:Undecaprenyl-phosphate glucose phosphotransferase
MATNVVNEHSNRAYARKSGAFRMDWEWAAIAIDLLVLWDGLSILIGALAADIIYRATFAPPDYDGYWDSFKNLIVSAVVLAPLALRDGNLRAQAARGRRRSIAFALAKRFVIFACALIVMGFATRTSDYLPRGWFAFWIASGFVMTLCGRLMVCSQLRMLQDKGILRERIAIVGAGTLADRLIGYLHKVDMRGIEIVGVFDDRAKTRLPAGATPPTGTVADLIETGKNQSIDWVLVTLPGPADKRLMSLASQLKSLATTVALCPEHLGTRVPILTRKFPDDNLAVTVLADRPLRRWDRVVKTVEDYVLASIATLLLLPVLGLIALAVKLDSPGPVLFRQPRHGWNNSQFNVFKFRTMRFEPAKTGGALKQTARDDERITRLGRFLRRSSLDELPQLLNVLRGEMSLVGPRPHAVNMQTEERYGHEIIDEYAHRHRMKPGITGWAQVHGYRGATDTVDQLRLRVEHDLYYIENWSLALDLKIMVLTVSNVLVGKNAY